MPMNLLQACRAGVCRRGGPRTMDPQLHDACIVEATWERPADRTGEPLGRFIQAAPKLCEAACERWTHPCWASHRIRVRNPRASDDDRSDWQNVCEDIYDKRLRFVEAMVRGTGQPYYLEEERWWRPVVPNDEPLPCEEY
jgi:hypothetical protein